MNVRVVDVPEAGTTESHYVFNHSPLVPNRLARLPLGSVRPAGWLKHQLDLMVDGMVGRLEEFSIFLKGDNGWFGTDNEAWEEQPYWLRGFYPLAVLTGDKRLLERARYWIEAVLTRQDDDGYFGGRFHKAVKGGSGDVLCDLWPHMVMLDAVILHHEATGDKRVIPFMTRFFEFCRDLPDERFIPYFGESDWQARREAFGNWKAFIQHKRAGDMIPHILWLYNRTQDAWLLDLARRFYDAIEPPEDEWLDHHIVHFTQRFSYPGVFHAVSHDAGDLARTEYWYAQHMAVWGQQPRGIFGADERVRPGKTDPRQGFETCGMIEFAKSFYLLGRLTGNPLYADRTEDVMLNHFPAAQTPDLKALHYLTASNEPQLDSSTKHDFFNGGRQIDYSPHLYRCCQHNVAMGWPWYVQNLWQATGDRGLAAWLYAAGEVTAKVGESAEVTIRSETDYPFKTAVAMTVEAASPVEFPLYLRVPRWCRGFTVSVNGEAVDAAARPGAYVRIERTWAAGDRVEIQMPVELSLTHWPRTGSVTVDRGPLSYSVRIPEDWK